MAANIIAIVGRPNVGKSTFYNRLVESRDAIMDNQSGVTRDRHYGQGEWIGKKFTAIDTGGYVFGSEDTFEGAIREQVEIALEEASVIIFMVDIFDGVTDLDKDFANVLRKNANKKPIYIAANKADNTERQHMTGEFYGLGIGEEVFGISSANGHGTGDLLDAVVSHFEDEGDEEEKDIPSFAILGRPNAGKSSLVNALLGNNRSIVTDIAGTTRDTVDAEYNLFGKQFILTDTAGIRKKSKVKENIEFYSVMRAIKSIERSDVCIIVIDASRGVESQDLNIIQLAFNNNKGVVIMVNKWDLIEKDTMTSKKFEDEIKQKLAPNDFIPIIFASVLEKQRIFKVIEKAAEVYENRTKKISTSQLNDVMQREIAAYPPPAYRGKFVKIKYITQLPTYTPTFAFFCNHPKHIQNAYKRYLENKLRSHFNFEGVPVRIFFREK